MIIFRPFLRSVATWILCLFLFSDIAGAVPQVGLSTPISDVVRLPHSFSVSLPVEIGQVEKIHSAGFGRPEVFHIQAAHGHYEAQKNIERILDHLNKQNGLDAVFVEGESENLYPELLKFLHEDEENRLLLDDLAQRGFVKGVEIFHSENPKIPVLGLEELNLYLKNGQDFTDAVRLKYELKNLIEDLETRMINRLHKSLNSELQAFVSHERKQAQKTLSFEAWLAYLEKTAKENLSVELGSPFSQLEYPMLSRVFAVQKAEDQFVAEVFQKEREIFLDDLSRHLNSDQELFQHFEEMLHFPHTKSFPYTSREVEAALENLMKVLPQDFPYSHFPQVNLFFTKHILQGEVDVTRMQDEIGKLSNAVVKKLSKNDAELKIYEQWKQFLIFRKLVDLQLTAKELESIPGDFANRLIEMDEDFNLVTELVSKALHFYEGAKERDNEMLSKTKTLMREDGYKKIAVVAGGFHSKPFQDFYHQNQFNYALMSPKITEQDEKGYQAYVRLSTQEFASNPVGEIAGRSSEIFENQRTAPFISGSGWRRLAFRQSLGEALHEALSLSPVISLDARESAIGNQRRAVNNTFAMGEELTFTAAYMDAEMAASSDQDLEDFFGDNLTAGMRRNELRISSIEEAFNGALGGNNIRVVVDREAELKMWTLDAVPHSLFEGWLDYIRALGVQPESLKEIYIHYWDNGTLYIGLNNRSIPIQGTKALFDPVRRRVILNAYDLGDYHSDSEYFMSGANEWKRNFVHEGAHARIFQKLGEWAYHEDAITSILNETFADLLPYFALKASHASKSEAKDYKKRILRENVYRYVLKSGHVSSNLFTVHDYGRGMNDYQGLAEHYERITKFLFYSRVFKIEGPEKAFFEYAELVLSPKKYEGLQKNHHGFMQMYQSILELLSDFKDKDPKTLHGLGFNQRSKQFVKSLDALVEMAQKASRNELRSATEPEGKWGFLKANLAEKSLWVDRDFESQIAGHITSLPDISLNELFHSVGLTFPQGVRSKVLSPFHDSLISTKLLWQLGNVLNENLYTVPLNPDQLKQVSENDQNYFLVWTNDRAQLQIVEPFMQFLMSIPDETERVKSFSAVLTRFAVYEVFRNALSDAEGLDWNSTLNEKLLAATYAVENFVYHGQPAGKETGITEQQSRNFVHQQMWERGEKFEASKTVKVTWHPLVTKADELLKRLRRLRDSLHTAGKVTSDDKNALADIEDSFLLPKDVRLAIEQKLYVLNESQLETEVKKYEARYKKARAQFARVMHRESVTEEGREKTISDLRQLNQKVNQELNTLIKTIFAWMKAQLKNRHSIRKSLDRLIDAFENKKRELIWNDVRSRGETEAAEVFVRRASDDYLKVRELKSIVEQVRRTGETQTKEVRWTQHETFYLTTLKNALQAIIGEQSSVTDSPQVWKEKVVEFLRKKQKVDSGMTVDQISVDDIAAMLYLDEALTKDVFKQFLKWANQKNMVEQDAQVGRVVNLIEGLTPDEKPFHEDVRSVHYQNLFNLFRSRDHVLDTYQREYVRAWESLGFIQDARYQVRNYRRNPLEEYEKRSFLRNLEKIEEWTARGRVSEKVRLTELVAKAKETFQADQYHIAVNALSEMEDVIHNEFLVRIDRMSRYISNHKKSVQAEVQKVTGAILLAYRTQKRRDFRKAKTAMVRFQKRYLEGYITDEEEPGYRNAKRHFSLALKSATEFLDQSSTGVPNRATFETILTNLYKINFDIEHKYKTRESQSELAKADDTRVAKRVQNDLNARSELRSTKGALSHLGENRRPDFVINPDQLIFYYKPPGLSENRNGRDSFWNEIPSEFKSYRLLTPTRKSEEGFVILSNHSSLELPETTLITYAITFERPIDLEAVKQARDEGVKVRSLRGYPPELFKPHLDETFMRKKTTQELIVKVPVSDRSLLFDFIKTLGRPTRIERKALGDISVEDLGVGFTRRATWDELFKVLNLSGLHRDSLESMRRAHQKAIDAEISDRSMISEALEDSFFLNSIFLDIFGRTDVELSEVNIVDIKHIGEGGFKRVYKVQLSVDGWDGLFEFVIKAVKPDVVESDSGYAYNLDYAHRIERVVDDVRSKYLSLLPPSSPYILKTDNKGNSRLMFAEGLKSVTRAKLTDKQRDRLAIEAYFKMFLATNHKVFLYDPKPANVHIEREGRSKYLGVILDLDNLMLDRVAPYEVIDNLVSFGFHSSDVIEVANEVLGTDSAMTLMRNAHSTMSVLKHSRFYQGYLDYFQNNELPNKKGYDLPRPISVYVNSIRVNIPMGTSLFQLLEDRYVRFSKDLVFLNEKLLAESDLLPPSRVRAKALYSQILKPDDYIDFRAGEIDGLEGDSKEESQQAQVFEVDFEFLMENDFDERLVQFEIEFEGLWEDLEDSTTDVGPQARSVRKHQKDVRTHLDDFVKNRARQIIPFPIRMKSMEGFVRAVAKVDYKINSDRQIFINRASTLQKQARTLEEIFMSSVSPQMNANVPKKSAVRPEFRNNASMQNDLNARSELRASAEDSEKGVVRPLVIRKDLYAILGARGPEADVSEIRLVYAALDQDYKEIYSREELDRDAEYQEIVLAGQWLMNKAKKKQYDELRAKYIREDRTFPEEFFSELNQMLGLKQDVEDSIKDSDAPKATALSGRSEVVGRNLEVSDPPQKKQKKKSHHAQKKKSSRISKITVTRPDVDEHAGTVLKTPKSQLSFREKMWIRVYRVVRWWVTEVMEREWFIRVHMGGFDNAQSPVYMLDQSLRYLYPYIAAEMYLTSGVYPRAYKIQEKAKEGEVAKGRKTIRREVLLNRYQNDPGHTTFDFDNYHGQRLFRSLDAKVKHGEDIDAGQYLQRLLHGSDLLGFRISNLLQRDVGLGIVRLDRVAKQRHMRKIDFFRQLTGHRVTNYVEVSFSDPVSTLQKPLEQIKDEVRVSILKGLIASALRRLEIDSAQLKIQTRNYMGKVFKASFEEYSEMLREVKRLMEEEEYDMLVNWQGIVVNLKEAGTITREDLLTKRRESPLGIILGHTLDNRIFEEEHIVQFMLRLVYQYRQTLRKAVYYFLSGSEFQQNIVKRMLLATREDPWRDLEADVKQSIYVLTGTSGRKSKKAREAARDLLIEVYGALPMQGIQGLDEVAGQLGLEAEEAPDFIEDDFLDEEYRMEKRNFDGEGFVQERNELRDESIQKVEVERSFLKFVQKRFQGQKRLRIWSVESHQVDFAEQVERWLSDSGFEVDVVTEDLLVRGAVTPRTDKFDLVFFNATPGLNDLSFSEVLKKRLTPRGAVVARFFTDVRDWHIRGKILEFIRDKKYPHLNLSNGFADLPKGNSQFEDMQRTVVVSGSPFYDFFLKLNDWSQTESGSRIQKHLTRARDFVLLDFDHRAGSWEIQILNDDRKTFKISWKKSGDRFVLRVNDFTLPSDGVTDPLIRFDWDREPGVFSMVFDEMYREKIEAYAKQLQHRPISKGLENVKPIGWVVSFESRKEKRILPTWRSNEDDQSDADAFQVFFNDFEGMPANVTGWEGFQSPLKLLYRGDEVLLAMDVEEPSGWRISISKIEAKAPLLKIVFQKEMSAMPGFENADFEGQSFLQINDNGIAFGERDDPLIRMDWLEEESKLVIVFDENYATQMGDFLGWEFERAPENGEGISYEITFEPREEKRILPSYMMSGIREDQGFGSFFKSLDKKWILRGGIDSLLIKTRKIGKENFGLSYSSEFGSWNAHYMSPGEAELEFSWSRSSEIPGLQLNGYAISGTEEKDPLLDIWWDEDGKKLIFTFDEAVQTEIEEHLMLISENEPGNVTGVKKSADWEILFKPRNVTEADSSGKAKTPFGKFYKNFSASEIPMPHGPFRNLTKTLLVGDEFLTVSDLKDPAGWLISISTTGVSKHVLKIVFQEDMSALSGFENEETLKGNSFLLMNDDGVELPQGTEPLTRIDWIESQKKIILVFDKEYREEISEVLEWKLKRDNSPDEGISYEILFEAREEKRLSDVKSVTQRLKELSAEEMRSRLESLYRDGSLQREFLVQSEEDMKERYDPVTGVIVLRKIDGKWKFLVMKRVKGGKYSFPGGKSDQLHDEKSPYYKIESTGRLVELNLIHPDTAGLDIESLDHTGQRELAEETEIMAETFHGGLDEFRLWDSSFVISPLIYIDTEETEELSLEGTDGMMTDPIWIPVGVLLREELQGDDVGYAVEEYLKEKREDASFFKGTKSHIFPGLREALERVANREEKRTFTQSDHNLPVLQYFRAGFLPLESLSFMSSAELLVLLVRLGFRSQVAYASPGALNSKELSERIHFVDQLFEDPALDREAELVVELRPENFDVYKQLVPHFSQLGIGEEVRFVGQGSEQLKKLASQSRVILERTRYERDFKLLEQVVREGLQRNKALGVTAKSVQFGIAERLIVSLEDVSEYHDENMSPEEIAEAAYARIKLLMGLTRALGDVSDLEAEEIEQQTRNYLMSVLGAPTGVWEVEGNILRLSLKSLSKRLDQLREVQTAFATAA